MYSYGEIIDKLAHIETNTRKSAQALNQGNADDEEILPNGIVIKESFSSEI